MSDVAQALGCHLRRALSCTAAGWARERLWGLRCSPTQARVQAAHQGPAVLGLAMISMGEDLGATMSLRMLEHLLRYGDAPVRCAPRQPQPVLQAATEPAWPQHACAGPCFIHPPRSRAAEVGLLPAQAQASWIHSASPCGCRQSVPLAVALMHVSNPDVQALDALSRLSHDADPDVAANAVLALGATRRRPSRAALAWLLPASTSCWAVFKTPVDRRPRQWHAATCAS